MSPLSLFLVGTALGVTVGAKVGEQDRLGAAMNAA